MIALLPQNHGFQIVEHCPQGLEMLLEMTIVLRVGGPVLCGVVSCHAVLSRLGLKSRMLHTSKWPRKRPDGTTSHSPFELEKRRLLAYERIASFIAFVCESLD